MLQIPGQKFPAVKHHQLGYDGFEIVLAMAGKYFWKGLYSLNQPSVESIKVCVDTFRNLNIALMNALHKQENIFRFLDAEHNGEALQLSLIDTENL